MMKEESSNQYARNSISQEINQRGSKGINIALYEQKIARFQTKYNLSMNMFTRKYNSSTVRKAEMVIKGDSVDGEDSTTQLHKGMSLQEIKRALRQK